MPLFGSVASITLLVLPAVAQQQVYPGCATPPTTFNHVWYIDPVNGKTAQAGGLGSQTAPWNSLQALFEPAPAGYPYPLLTTTPYTRGGSGWVPGPLAGPVAPGDEVLLMSGNYGAVSIGEYQTPVNNAPGFVTIAAAPGQIPVISSLVVNPASGFVFEGISFAPQTPSSLAPNLITVSGVTAYPTSNIIFNAVSAGAAPVSVADTWTTAAQWSGSVANGVMFQGGPATTCIALTSSHVFTEHFGVQIFSNNSLLANNEIDHVTDDTVDYGSTNLIMRYNYVHDPIGYPFNPAHYDGFQGLGGVFTNIKINGNLIVDQADKNNPFPTWFDGIDNYSYESSSYDDVTVTNNVVVTSSGTGILFARLTNSKIVNNTLIASADGGGGSPSITIEETTAPANIQVFNNIAPGLNIAPGPTGTLTQDTTVDVYHNVITSTMLAGHGNPVAFCLISGIGTYYPTPGTLPQSICTDNGAHNFIDGVGSIGEFAVVNSPLLTYNLNLQSSAPAMTAGTPAGMPPLNILGKPRVVTNGTVPAGAY